MSRDGRTLVEGLRFHAGEGDETFEMQAGSYREVSGSTDWEPLEVDAGAFTAEGDALVVTVGGGGNRVRWDAACTGDDHFAGLGQHAMDVDHVGEAFPLWVSEPGIGKTESEASAADWFLTGTKHATSYPDPFLVRPEPLGLQALTGARVEVDLCTGDRWTVDAWEATASFELTTGATPLDVVRRHALRDGPPLLPPDWAYAPWNDAVGGTERVLAVATALRESGATSSVLWTEDWKGAEETAWGYHLLPEWELDEALYPDAAGTAAALEALGFQWFAYFSPFLVVETQAWDEAADLLIRDGQGDPYTFTGVTFDDTSVLDLTREDAREWAREKMAAVQAVGFDGWMADYAEWLPTDAVLDGADAEDAHNLYPLWWQETNAGTGAVYFTRSGWSGTPVRSPTHWAGDQRTSFDTDDGYPTVVPMGIGAGLSGLLLYGSDIAGYQSIGNPPSTGELWFRWCTLGALSPLMRTHHGAFADDNWQFDSDTETLEHFARWSRIHASLFPYLRGLVARGDGTPLILAPFLLHDEPWDRTDAYLLGPSLFVAPVLVEGATSRAVDLPDGTWYDWWTGEVAGDGVYDAPIDTIPVFAPAGAVVPLLAEAPDTFLPGPLPGLTTLDDADSARIVRVFAGAAGTFTEADGTRYETDGVATGSGTTSATLASGTLEAGGLTLTVTGEVERTYTLDVAR